MAVKLVPRFDKKQIRQFLDAKRENVRNAVILNLQRVGEQFIAKARTVNTYKDQTGNLRSSKGYVIMENGRQIRSAFSSAPGPERGGPEGVDRGEEVAAEVAADHPLGFVLVCVAGMQYAKSVEDKGYDVITNSSTAAAASLRKAMARLLKKIGR